MKLWDLVAAGLTEREREIAYCLLAGLGREEIAKELAISSQAVAYHLARMYRRFEIDPGLIGHVALAVKLYGYCTHTSGVTSGITAGMAAGPALPWAM
jgi:hypothetical protein